MPNSYFEFDPEFIPGTKARAGDVNTQFAAVEAAFDLLPVTPSALTRGVAELGTESGSGNTYVVTMPNTRLTNQNGDLVLFKATHSNTGAITLNVDGIGAVAARGVDDVALSGGEIISGRFYAFRYNSTTSRFHLTEDSNASNKVVYAAEWANKAYNSLVSTAAGGDGVDDYSALHWATVAAAAAAGVGVQNVAFRGDHDASGNTAPLTPADRSIYRISVAGTFASLSWAAGDYALYNGTTWERISTVSATNLTAGTLPDARFPATLPAVSGANLTALNATALASGTVADARLSTNVPLLDAANTFLERQIISNAVPQLVLFDSNNPADERIIWVSGNSGWGIAFVNDAETATNTAIRALRSGITVTEVEINAALVDINGAADFSSTVTAGGNFLAGGAFTFIGDTDTFFGLDSSDITRIVAGGSQVATFGASEIDLTAITLDFNGAADFSSNVVISGASNYFYAGGSGGFTWNGDSDTYFDNSGDNIRVFAGNSQVAAFAQAEIDLTATAIDINGAIDADGTTHDINGSTSVTLTGTANAVVALTTSGFNIDGNIDADGTTHDLDAATSLSLHGGSADIVLSGTTAAVTAASITGNGIDMTPQSSSFTGTLTGMTTSTTGTVQYRILGGMYCVLYINSSILGTSNTIAMTMTGLPAAVTPANLREVTCYSITDGVAGSGRHGRASITAASTITFDLDDGAGGVTSFANSGSKGLTSGWTVMYPLS